MTPVIQEIKAISHPLVSSIYMKKNLSGAAGENVLVIETMFPDRDAREEEDYLFDLLVDLEAIKRQAEIDVGSFIDRVDIRKHH